MNNDVIVDLALRCCHDINDGRYSLCENTLRSIKVPELIVGRVTRRDYKHGNIFIMVGFGQQVIQLKKCTQHDVELMEEVLDVLLSDSP